MRMPVLLAFAALSMTGCAAMRRDAAADTESTLAAAGFTVNPAVSPERAAMIASLPPNRISQRIEGSHISYLYPDPINCHCLYIGGQEAYGRYQQIAIQQRIAREQVEAAQLNSSFAWDWGPWGGYGPAFY